jgi:hypothetical protein
LEIEISEEQERDIHPLELFRKIEMGKGKDRYPGRCSGPFLMLAQPLEFKITFPMDSVRKQETLKRHLSHSII